MIVPAPKGEQADASATAGGGEGGAASQDQNLDLEGSINAVISGINDTKKATRLTRQN